VLRNDSPIHAVSTHVSVSTPTPSRRGNRVEFSLSRTLDVTPDRAWALLIDWPGHADWVPMTRVEVDPDNPDRFTAWSGLGRLALEDRMQVRDIDHDSDIRRCVVDKLGPILVGEAEFSVAAGPSGVTSIVTWREDVHVPYLPRVLTGIVGRIGAALFSQSLRRMARVA